MDRGLPIIAAGNHHSPNGTVGATDWATRLSPAALLVGAGAFALALGVTLPANATLAIFGLLAAALAVVCFVRPSIGLFVFVFLLYSRTTEVLNRVLGLPSSIPGSAIYFAVLLISVGVSLRGLAALKPARPQDWYPLALYGFVQLGSVLIAVDQAAALKTTITYVEDMALIAIVVLSVRRFADLHVVVWALIVGISIPAYLTIFQVVTGSHNAFFNLGQQSEQLIAAGGSTLVVRPSGPVADPNFYALALVPIIPVALYEARHATRRFLRILAGISAIAIGVAAVLTYSRGGFFALSIVLLMCVIFGLLRVRYVVIGALLVLMSLPLLPGSYVGRFADVSGDVPASIQGGSASSEAVDTSVTGRLAVAEAGVLMFVHHPVLGVGISNFKAHFQDYGRSLGIATRSERSPHSLYIQIAAETGILGLLAFATIISSQFAHLRTCWSTWSRAPERRDLAIALAVALVGYLAGSMFLHAAYPRFLWVLIAAVLAARTLAGEVSAPAGRRLPRGSNSVRSSLVLGGTGLVVVSVACVVGLWGLFGVR